MYVGIINTYPNFYTVIETLHVTVSSKWYRNNQNSIIQSNFKGNTPMTPWCPAQSVSNAGSVSMSWRHNITMLFALQAITYMEFLGRNQLNRNRIVFHWTTIYMSTVYSIVVCISASSFHPNRPQAVSKSRLPVLISAYCGSCIPFSWSLMFILLYNVSTCRRA